jgi:Ca2+-binding EF-hand superfamily protein
VDDDGVTVTEEDFYASIESRNHAMLREEVEIYLATIMSEYKMGASRPIPEAFKLLDEDGNGYISFDELLVAIDLYFDFKLDLSIVEVRELNDFFFSQ